MRKKITAVLLCVIMVMALLPSTTFAANATSVWIWGQELTTGNAYYHNGPAGMKGYVDNSAIGSNAYFDVTTATLTLNGLSALNSTETQVISLDGEDTHFTYAVFADGDLTINVTTDSAISTGTGSAGYANVALGVNGNVNFRGSASLIATSGTGESTVGVQVLRELKVLSGTLTGAAGDAGGSVVSAESFGVSAATLTVSDGNLIGNSGRATATSNCISAGICAGDVIVSGGFLDATGSTATADYALSYGLYVTSLGIQDGVTNAQGGEAHGGDFGGYSAGVNVFDVTVSGGSLTASGDLATATGDAYSQSCGIYAETDTIRFSGGTVKATGGEAGIDSYGIMNAGTFNTIYPPREYESGGAITVSGTADVEATGGTSQTSYGLWCRDTGLTVSAGELTATGGSYSETSIGVCASDDDSLIKVTGGTLTAKTGNASTGSALNKAFTFGSRIVAVCNTTNVIGTEVYYSEDNDTYLWVQTKKIPGLIITMSPSGNVDAGTNVTLNAVGINFDDLLSFPSSYTFQWYSNTINSKTGAVQIPNQSTAYYKPPTIVPGTMYYYCVIPDVAESYLIGVTVNQPQSDEDSRPPVTVYNDASVSDATVWLTGSGLNSSDLLVTERDPKGSSYEALMKLADRDYIFGVYSITLLSGTKYTGNSMHLTFDLNTTHPGDTFTLVHQKADNSYEYFYSNADSNGSLTFGPLYELSPFMLVKGRLTASSAGNPQTSDRSQPSLWLGAALLSSSGLGACLVIRRRNHQKG